MHAVQDVLNQGGVTALFGRGLSTRLLANGLQSIVFTVIWKYLSHKEREKENTSS